MAERLNIETKVYSTFEVAEIVLKALEEERIVGGSYGNADYRCAVGWLLDLSTCEWLDSKEYRMSLPSYPFADVLVERGFISVVGPVPDYGAIYAEHTPYGRDTSPYDTLTDNGARFLRVIQDLVDSTQFGAVRALCEATLALKPTFTKKEVATLVLHKLDKHQIKAATYHSPEGRRCAIGWLLPKATAEAMEANSNAVSYVLADALVRGDRLEIVDGDADWAQSVQHIVDSRQWGWLHHTLTIEMQ